MSSLRKKLILFEELMYLSLLSTASPLAWRAAPGVMSVIANWVARRIVNHIRSSRVFVLNLQEVVNGAVIFVCRVGD